MRKPACASRNTARTSSLKKKKISILKILLHQFTSPLIYILLTAGIITVLLEEYIDSGVIVAVVVMNAIIGFIHEFKAEESVRSLKKMVVPKAKAIRDGREMVINSEDLVPGDIVLLASGAMVPADILLLHTIELARLPYFFFPRASPRFSPSSARLSWAPLFPMCRPSFSGSTWSPTASRMWLWPSNPGKRE